MKTFRLPLALFFIGGLLPAQDATPTPLAGQPAPGGLSTTNMARRMPQELDQLLAPIALYPDALIALILPAATAPTDIVLAARHLRDNPGDTSQIEHRAWDESVKSLTSYPDVVKWMDENLPWTKQVGEAFAEQAADVMESIQRLRGKARAAGTLVDTPQQQVLAEPQVIRIVPAQPDTIYVPYYDPEIVYLERPTYYPRPFLTFGIGVPVGAWLAFDCDWRGRSIWYGDRHRRWSGHDWHRPLVPFVPGRSFSRQPEVRQWRPPVQYTRSGSGVPITQRTRPTMARSEIVRPVPIEVTTARSYGQRNLDSSGRRQNANTSSLGSPSSPGFTYRSPGPGGNPRISAPTAPAAASLPAVTPDPTPAPGNRPANGRRGTGEGARDGETRTRGPRGNDASAGSALPAVPALPMATPAPNAPATPAPQLRDNESRNRGYRGSQASQSASLPAVPSLPMASPTQNSQPAGPTVQRSYSRAAPPAAAPAPSVPSLPMASRSIPAAPPATVAPATAPASAPAAQPNSGPRSGSGESRGVRSGGGGGGRRDDNSQVR